MSDEKELIEEATQAVDDYNEQLRKDLEPYDLNEPYGSAVESPPLPPLPTTIDELRNEAARGNHRAAAVLRVILEGAYEESKIAGSKGSVCGYGIPDVDNKKSIEELRSTREYSKHTVDEFLLKITDPSFIPPGTALILFISFLTNMQINFISRALGSELSSKAMQLFYFFREAEAWTKVNILIGMKNWFVKKADKGLGTTDGPFEKYLAPFKQAARAADAAKAEVTDVGQEQDPKDD
jgi:hypothetical protein